MTLGEGQVDVVHTHHLTAEVAQTKGFCLFMDRSSRPGRKEGLGVERSWVKREKSASVTAVPSQ